MYFRQNQSFLEIFFAFLQKTTKRNLKDELSFGRKSLKKRNKYEN